MKNYNFGFKRILAVLVLLTAFINTALPTMAMAGPDMGANQQVLPTVGGQYGANLNNVTGATVTPGTNYADVTTPGQASYLQWNNLNTAPGQTLNYTFLNNGTSFNSVIGGGLSRFAGSITQDGAGRIVISNPNGILFENGAMVNANAMTLTTQEIQGFNPVTNTVTWGAYGNGGIQIGQGDLNNAAVMRINQDLTVVAPAGIAVNGADILAGDVKLVTTDGVNYYASNEGITNIAQAGATLTTPHNEVLTANTNFDGVKQAILVKDSAIAVKDNTTGKIYFSTKAGLDVNSDIAVRNSTINGNIKMDVAGNAILDLNSDINIVESNVSANLFANTPGNFTMDNPNTAKIGTYVMANNVNIFDNGSNFNNGGDNNGGYIKWGDFNIGEGSIPALTLTNIQVLPTVNGEYGANLKSSTGAIITPGTTYADITTAGQASYLQWNTLNTAPGQTLNYTFLNNGTSFNSVIGGGLSRFAGSLTQTGAGRIVLSNPNGILFENGAMVNANAMTLTTQEIQSFNPMTDTITWGAYGNGGIQIGQGDMTNAAVIKINDDLTVVSPKGIAIKGAGIIAGDVKLITTDSMNYYAANAGITNETQANATLTTPQNKKLTVDTNYNNSNNAVLIKDSGISLGDISTGKILIVTNPAKKENLTVTNSSLDGKIEMDISGNANLNVIGNLNIANSKVNGNLIAETINNEIALTNHSITPVKRTTLLNAESKTRFSASGNGEVTIDGTSIGGNATIKGANIHITNSDFKSLQTESVGGVTSPLSCTTITTYSNPNPPSNTIEVYTSDFDMMGFRASSINLGGTILNGVTVRNGNLTVNANSNLIMNGNSIINITDSNISGNLKTLTKGDIIVNKTTASSLTAGAAESKGTPTEASNSLSITGGSRFWSAKAFATDININASKAYGGELRATNNINLDNQAYINNTKLNAGNGINITNYAQVNQSELAANTDISLTDAVVCNSNLTAQRNITVNHSTLKNSIANAVGNIQANNYSDIGNSTLIANNNITLDTINLHNDSLPTTATVNAGNEVNMNNSDITRANIKANNVIARGTTIVNWSKINADNDITVTDYHTWIFASEINANNNINITEQAYVKNSTLTAENDINVYKAATINDSTLNASNDINVYGSIVSYSDLTATNNINVGYSSRTDNSSLTAGNSINVDSSTLNNMGLTAEENINITNSGAAGENEAIAKTGDVNIDNTIYDSFNISAGNDAIITNSSGTTTIVSAQNNSTTNYLSSYGTTTISAGGNSIINNSVFGDTTITANQTSTINGSTLGNTTITSGGNSKIKDSTLLNTNITAEYDSNIFDSSFGSLKVNVTNDSFITSSDYIDANITAGHNSWITDVMGGDTTVNAINDSNINDMSFLGATSITAGNDSNINSSLLYYTTINAGNDSNINNTYFDGLNVTTGNDANFVNSVTGDTIIQSGNNTNLMNSSFHNIEVTAGGNIASIDSDLGSGLFNATGNINLTGLYVAYNLNITGANDVVISNSNSAAPIGPPTVTGLSTGLKPMSDYDRTRFNDSTFKTVANKLGYGAPAYGDGFRASIIGGDVNISNVNSVAIVNTAITGNLTEGNISTDTSLIYSYVGGNYTRGSNIGGEASLFRTSIRGNYERIYPDVSTNLNDAVKLKYGSQLDTNFKQQFTPKGFAASDDEINTMKRQAISNIVKTKNNTIKFNNTFKAY